MALSSSVASYLLYFIPSYLLFYMMMETYLRNRKSQLHLFASLLMLTKLLFFLGEFCKDVIMRDMQSAIVVFWSGPMLLISLVLYVAFYAKFTGLQHNIQKGYWKYIYIGILSFPFVFYFLGLLYSGSTQQIFNEANKTSSDLGTGLHPIIFVSIFIISFSYYSISIIILYFGKRCTTSTKKKQAITSLLIGLLCYLAWMVLITLLITTGIVKANNGVYLYYVGDIFWAMSIRWAMSKYDVLPIYTNRYLTLFKNSPTPIILTNHNHEILEVNQAAANLLGKAGHLLVGSQVFNWFTNEKKDQLQEKLFESNVAIQNLSTQLLTADGERIHILIDCARYEDQFDDVMVLFLRDVSEIRKTEKELTDSQERFKYLASHDSLTGLYNRLAFNEYLQQHILDYQENKHPFALLMADLDDFKEINDSYGHAVGDQLLCHFANVLKKGCRSHDIIARLGGDEFVLIIQGVTEHDAVVDVCERITTILEKPTKIDNTEIYMHTSIGICFCPQDGIDSTNLMRKVDQAMYTAKNKGNNRFQFWSA